MSAQTTSFESAQPKINVPLEAGLSLVPNSVEIADPTLPQDISPATICLSRLAQIVNKEKEAKPYTELDKEVARNRIALVGAIKWRRGNTQLTRKFVEERQRMAERAAQFTGTHVRSRV